MPCTSEKHVLQQQIEVCDLTHKNRLFSIRFLPSSTNPVGYRGIQAVYRNHVMKATSRSMTLSK